MGATWKNKNKAERRHGIEKKIRERDMTALGPCVKKTYMNKQAAKLRLSYVRALRRGQSERGELLPGKGGERTIYRCPTCGYWHLTSQAKDLRPDIPLRGWQGKR